MLDGGSEGGHAANQDEEPPVNELVGLFDREAAKYNHEERCAQKTNRQRKEIQTAKDDCRYKKQQRVDSFSSLERRRIQFPENGEFPFPGESLEDILVRLDHQQVAHLELHRAGIFFQGVASAVDGQNGQPLFFLVNGVERPVEQIRMRRHEGLCNFGVGILPILAAAGQARADLDALTFADPDQDFDVTGDHENIPFLEGSVGSVRDTLIIAQDSEYAEAGFSEIRLEGGLTDQRRLRQNDDLGQVRD